MPTMADEAQRTMTGAQIVASILKQQGMKHIVGFPSSELFDASAELDVPPVIARTQRVAVNLAEGYARTAAPEDLTVVTVQYGPGAESAFGGIAQAYNDRAPILFLPTGYPRGSEAVAPNFEARRNFQHVTKWCESVTRIEQLPQLLYSAISRVRNGPPAPVLLELPVDVLGETHELDPRHVRDVRRSQPQADARQIDELVETLLAAEHPVILAGQGVLNARASRELAEFAELVNIPVMTTPNAKSAFSERHPFALGTAGRARPGTVDRFIEKADVILALGTSLTRSYYILPIPAGKTLLQVSIDEGDLGKDYPVRLGVIGDCRAVLRQMLARVCEDPATLARRAPLRDALAHEISVARRAFMEHWLPLLNAHTTPISPYRVVWEMMQTLERDRVIVTHDAGNPRDQFSPFYDVTEPGGYLGWGKTTQLGSSLGFALGAKLARPDATVVAIMGEAAFGMVGIDFETAVRCDLPILTVVMRNHVLGGYAASMPVASTKYRANRMSGEYAPIARALGGHGECVEDPAQLRAALQRCLATVEGGRAALLEIVTHEESRLAGLSRV
ncbi:thiamine pyrophosphate-requiring protein [Paraburkholderia sp. SARCC-3016]|uniref:thiamine pyrophosphate-requiring protein n=1 Tax=Paraburkholderia sp. SARCC-3016 TaxID=3058611 RepID=UPI002807646A|nr:thiamine pyrophosphate-requiring protein [Paraburkholderia sp. SARCC-3016]MDQ7982057.1 thiamine pyrophosphate-requiring protein [Paraburkholderia sp. SARCC-3016]